MAPSALLTILWGETPIAMHHLARGRSIGIDEAGIASPARDATAIVVRMDAREAVVSIPGSDRGLRAIPVGERVEIRLTPEARPVYRRRGRWDPHPIALRIAVSAEAPRPFRRPAIAWRALGSVVATAVACAVAMAGSRAGATPSSVSNDGIHLTPSSSIHLVVAPEPFREVEDDDLASDAPASCAYAADVLAGHSYAIRGPIDNPDPHVRTFHDRIDELAPDLPDLRRDDEGIDDPAIHLPWGGHDAVGWDRSSRTGTARGDMTHGSWPTCFGPAPSTWACDDAPPDPPTPASLGIPGIGEIAPAPASPVLTRASLLGSGERWRHSRPPRVAVGPIAVAANVPRWAVAAGVREAVASARDCYGRALLDDADLTGSFRAVLRIRDGREEISLSPEGGVAGAPALQCCLEHIYEGLADRLPTATRATARYTISFGG